MRDRFQARFLFIGLLGFFSGLPLALTASTLTAWLSDAKIDRAAIGLFAAVATPYALKFLWAPLVDGIRLPWLGRRRGWLLIVQLALALALAAMAKADPAVSVGVTAMLAVAVASLSATQDIVIDAYRVELLSAESQGTGAAWATFGYRMGMLVSGAGALAMADRFGWATTYLAMAGVMTAGAVVTLLVGREPEGAPAPQVSFEGFFRRYVVEPFTEFARRKDWLWILAFVVLYKLGDAFLGIMFNPFLLDLGFTKTQIAAIVKLYGLVATILGSFLGGWLVARFGMVRVLILGGLLHMATNLMLVVQAKLGADMHFLIVSISAENFSGGVTTTAFVAYLSALCRRDYTATQYALLSALASLARSVLSTPAGWLSQTLGWGPFFAIASLMALPGLALLWRLEKQRR